MLKRRGTSAVTEAAKHSPKRPRPTGPADEPTKESPPSEAAAHTMLHLSQKSQTLIEDLRPSQLDGILNPADVGHAEKILSSQFEDQVQDPPPLHPTSQGPLSLGASGQHPPPKFAAPAAAGRVSGRVKAEPGRPAMLQLEALGPRGPAATQDTATTGSMDSGSLDRSGRRRGGEGSGKGQRRGPMDEMRQLVRILQKLFPASHKWMADREGGGGNRVSEAQINTYLKRLLGPGAPQPVWGVKDGGWHTYVAKLLTWCSGKEVTPEQAKQVASRQQGRSWELNQEMLDSLGLRPTTWELPLSKAGAAAAPAERMQIEPAGAESDGEVWDRLISLTNDMIQRTKGAPAKQAPNAQEAAFVEAAQKLARLVGMPLVEASRAQNWPAFGGEVQGGASARGGARDGVGGLGKGPLALFKGGGAAVGPNGDPPKPAAAQSAVMIGNGILGQAPIPIKHALPPDLSRLLAGPKKEEEVSVSGGVRAARGDTGAEAAGPVASADGGPGAREAGPAPLQLGVGSQDLLVPARAVPGSQDFWMGSGRAGTSQGLHDVPGSPDRNRVHGRGGYGKAGAAKTLSPRRAPIP